MKKLLFVLICVAAPFFAHAQNVGIGTVTPNASALLHVDLDTSSTKGLLVNGSFTAGSVPNLGAGTRMMFYPGKSAFRAGNVNGTQWDNVNVGYYSTAMGKSTTASAHTSTAMGYLTTASANSSIAMGDGTTASGLASTAMGAGTIASGDFSIATGYQTNASGNYSTAMGDGTTASGTISTAMGYTTTAKSGFETSMGSWNTDYTPVDPYGWAASDRLFTIGNGTGSSSRSDAMTILKNGNVYIDPSNKNDGTLNGNTLLFGTSNGTGEGISSRRTAGVNQYGLDFYTGYYSRMSINNDGNVGIGTASPGEKLTIRSNDNTAVTNIGAFYSYNLSQGIGIGYDEIRKIVTNANSDLLINAKGIGNLILQNSATGNVGIGTAIPAAKLQVLAGDASLALFGPNATYGTKLYVGSTITNQSNASTAQVFVSDGNLHIDPAQGHNIYIGYYQARDIYLDPAGGNVGIGTTNPQKNLSIQNGMNVDQADGNTGSVINAISFGSNSGEGIGSKRNAGGNQWGLDLYTSGGNRMSITNGGNVGIGTANPATKLEINGYTKLGSDAPSIKTKKLTGTTAATQGGFAIVPHGLDYSKIISVTVLVYSGSGGLWVPPHFQTFSGTAFDWFLGFGGIRVDNIFSNSVNILSAPIKILITYEE